MVEKWLCLVSLPKKASPSLPHMEEVDMFGETVPMNLPHQEACTTCVGVLECESSFVTVSETTLFYQLDSLKLQGLLTVMNLIVFEVRTVLG